MMEVNHDYEAAVRRIEQLEKLNAMLSVQVDRALAIITVAEVIADYGFSLARYKDLQMVVDKYRAAKEPAHVNHTN